MISTTRDVTIDTMTSRLVAYEPRAGFQGVWRRISELGIPRRSVYRMYKRGVVLSNGSRIIRTDSHHHRTLRHTHYDTTTTVLHPGVRKIRLDAPILYLQVAQLHGHHVQPLKQRSRDVNYPSAFLSCGSSYIDL